MIKDKIKKNFLLDKHLFLKKILSDKSDELKEIQKYIPDTCSIFKKNNILMKNTKKYIFDIDKNSSKRFIKTSIQGIMYFTSFNGNIINKKKRIGVIFSGGPSPGGHNVIWGLFDALNKTNDESILLGFINGIDGLIEKKCIKINKKNLYNYKNLGGFHMLRTSRTKVDSLKKIKLIKKTCKLFSLDALVIVGGDDSNTNAAFLAEEMFNDNIRVIGIPKTIDGDIQVEDNNGHMLCSLPFGFHSASKTISHLISNLCIDAISDRKYWHVCKIMGRTASHLALEVALQTHVNITLIGEEIINYHENRKVFKKNEKTFIDNKYYGMTLDELVESIISIIVKRARIGKQFGVMIFPEGILEYVNEIQLFISKFNTILGEYNNKNIKKFHEVFKTLEEKTGYLKEVSLENSNISHRIWSMKDHYLFIKLPKLLQSGLLSRRDSHGNFQFSQVKTDEILLDFIKKELNILKKNRKFILGINKKDYYKIVKKEVVNANLLGSLIFKNWEKEEYLLLNSGIKSKKDIYNIIVGLGFSNNIDKIPEWISKLFEKSIPKFMAQTHFYGYDARGNNPSIFDCTYAYNLGHTAFHLINNGASGVMASILNVEQEFDKWDPIGIPLPSLMHLEERSGKLSLVLEKKIVDTKSPAFLLFKKLRKKWSGIDSNYEHYRLVNPINLDKKYQDKKPMTILINCAYNTKI